MNKKKKKEIEVKIENGEAFYLEALPMRIPLNAGHTKFMTKYKYEWSYIGNINSKEYNDFILQHKRIKFI